MLKAAILFAVLAVLQYPAPVIHSKQTNDYCHLNGLDPEIPWRATTDIYYRLPVPVFIFLFSSDCDQACD